jgi:type I restriction enzyme S subunit
MPRADWNQIKNFSILIPTVIVRQRFEELAKPIIERIETLAFQNHSLTEARDRLLPKLMNGEIEV